MEFQTVTICRGCRHEFKVAFEDSEYWREHKHPVQCPSCESKLLLECQRDMIGMNGKVHTRTKLLKHTDKLLSLLGLGSDSDTPPKEA